MRGERKENLLRNEILAPPSHSKSRTYTPKILRTRIMDQILLLNLCDCYTTVTAKLLRRKFDIGWRSLDRDAQTLREYGITIDQAKVRFSIVSLELASASTKSLV